MKYDAWVFSIANLPADLKDEYAGVDEYRSVLVIRHDGKIVANHLDGGEPEDNSFGRDHNWIAPALRDAYQRGYVDAINDSFSHSDSQPDGFKDNDPVTHNLMADLIEHRKKLGIGPIPSILNDSEGSD